VVLKPDPESIEILEAHYYPPGPAIHLVPELK
jgi:hypothetical protein